MAYNNNDPFADLPDASADPFADLPDASSGGLAASFGSGVDKVQEIGYRALKGFTDVGENPNDYEEGSAGRWVAESIGQGGSLSRFADKGIARNLQEQQAYTPTVGSYKDVDSLGSAASYVGELTAGSIPYMGAALYPPTLFAMGGGLSNEAYEAQEDKSPLRAVASGYGQIALERLGALGSLGKIGGVAKDAATGKVKSVVKSALGEGATEAGQDALAQWGAGASLDELDVDSLQESFVGGAAVGGTIRTGTEAYNATKEKIKPTLSDTETTDLLSDPEDAQTPVQQTVGGETVDYDPTIAPSAISPIEGEAANDWRPNWEFGQNDMPINGQMQPYTYEGELDPFHDIPSSVPVGQVLEAPIIEGEFERPRGLPDRSSVIYGEDGRPMQQAQEFAQQAANNYQPQIEQKDIIFAGDERGVQLKQDGTPFGGKKAVSISKGFKDANAQGLNPSVVQVNGGYGWVAENGDVGLDTGSIGQPSDQQVGSTGTSLPGDVRGDNGGRLRDGADGAIRSGDAESSIVAARRDTNDNALVTDPEAPQINDDIINADIEIAANEAATSPLNELAEPTQGQKEAGNYKKGKVKLHGLNISIENPKGSERKGVDESGKEWTSTMAHHYGDIKGTVGADGDSIDTFIGDKPTSEKVFVVDQINPNTGEFDEHKVMLGFDSKEAAEAGYLSNYDKDWKGAGNITETTTDELKSWMKKPRKSKQPFAPIEKNLSTETVDNSEPLTKKGTVLADKAAEKFEDFGEKLEGAKKHTYSFTESLNKEDVDVKSVPLSVSIPKPDNEKLIASGVKPEVAAAISHIRSMLPAKPRSKYKINAWVNKAETARKSISKLLSGDLESIEKNSPVSGQNDIFKLANDIKPSQIADLANYTLSKEVYGIYKGEKDVSKWVVTNTGKNAGFGGMGNQSHFDNKEDALTYVKAQVSISDSNGKPINKFDIWTERGKAGYFIGKKVGTGKYIELGTAKSRNEAISMVENDNEKLTSMLADKKRVGSHRRAEQNERIGKDYRKGKNVSSDLFSETFGFRGVQFGNYVENDKRQQDINNAYDGLLDLADVIGVSPKALSLNGKLGLAFGARGSGGKNSAAAHYEKGSTVINLTKRDGAGSLAHEWFHALDNYFGKADKLTKTQKGDSEFMTKPDRVIGMVDGTTHRRTKPDDFTTRPEVFEAFQGVIKAVKSTGMVERSSVLDGRKSKDYWSTHHELAARAFETFVIDKLKAKNFESDYLATVLPKDAWDAVELSFGNNKESYPYPTKDEAKVTNEAYQKLFDTIQEKAGDDGNIALFKRSDSVGFSTDNSNASTTGDTGAVTLEDANKVIDGIVSNWDGDNRANDFVIAESFEQLPTNIKDAAKQQGAEGQVKGVFHKGKTYLVLEQHTSTTELEETIYHETYGHQGLRKMYGPDLPKKLNQLFVAIGGISGLRVTAKRNGVNLSAYEKGLQQAGTRKDVANQILMDELLAHMQQSNKPSVKRFAMEAIGLIRAGLRKMGFTKLAKLNDADLFHILRKSRKAVQTDGKSSSGESDVMFSRTNPEESPFILPEETKQERAIRFVQDKLNRVKKAQKVVGESGINTSDSADVYGKESLYYGKVEEDFRQLSQEYIEPIADKLAKADIPQVEFDLYLYALHAKERNAYISTINEGMESGSGMTNQEADAIIAAVNASPKRKAFRDANRMVRSMIDKRVETMRDAGLIDEETFASLQDSYENYVPLKGQAKDEGGKPKGTGMGFNIKGKETIAALGRQSKAESPVLHSFIDTQEAIVRGHKNEVGNAMLKLIEEAPNPDLWNAYTTEGPTKREKDSSGKVVEKAMSASTMSALASSPMSEWFTTKRDGVTHYMKFEDPLIAQQMKNFGVDNGNAITRTLGMVNRYLSMMSTSLNPEFLVTNLVRDVQTAVFNIAAETEIADGKIKGLDANKFAKQSLKDLPKAFKGIRSVLRDNNTDSEWSQVFDQFRKNGAKTGYFDMKDLEGQERDLKNLMKLESKSQVMKFKDGALKFIEDYNSSVENAIRLSVYKNALDKGISQHKAAVLAKNLTVNFNRKGEAGTWLNSLFLFANAGIQGTANFARAIGTFKVVDGKKKLNLAQKAGIAMAGIAFSMSVMNRMLSDDDDDGESYWDKIPEHVKERNFVLMHPNGKDYFTLPMPYGYNVFANMGTAAESLMSGGKVSENAAFLVKAVMGSFVPLGLSEGNDALETTFKTLTPQIGKPFVDIMTNTNFFGSQIYSDANNMWGDKRSDSALGRDKTNEIFKTTAKGLNSATGGTEYQEGGIDVHPETLRYIAEYLGGGAGATVLRTAETIARGTKGEFEASKTPFIRKVYGKLTDYSDQTDFYNRADEVSKYKAEFSSLRGKERYEFKKENEDLIRLEPMADQTKKSLKQLRNRKKLLAKREGAEEKIKQIDDKMETLVDRFNKRYNEAMEKR